MQGKGGEFILLWHNLSVSVKAARQELELSNEEMACRTGISRATLTGILQGEGNLRLSTVERIAEKLGHEPVRLLCFAHNDEERVFLEQTLEMVDKAGALSPDKRERFMELFRTLVRCTTDED